MDYARFWSMQDHSVAQVRDFYAALCGSGHAQAWLGSHQGRPAFLVECYDPAHDQIGEHYPVRPGDIGMHIFIGPPTQRIPGFSRDVFALVMRFLFDRLNAARVVVEPDANNAKIHALNLAMGFVTPGRPGSARKPPASPSAPAPTSRPNFRSPPYEPPRHATSVPGRQPP